MSIYLFRTLKISILLMVLFDCNASYSNSPIKLFYISGNVDMLIDTNGKVFFEAPKEFRIVNSNLKSYGSILGDAINLKNDIIYNFTDFPILAQDRSSGFFCLIDENINVHYIHKQYTGISKIHEGYYLAAYQEKGILRETRYEFLDRFGRQVFKIPNDYWMASYFSEGLAPIKVNGWLYLNDLGHKIDILPDSLKVADYVNSFKNGFSLIKRFKYENNGKSNTLLPYFISKDGKSLLNVSKIVGNSKISNVSDFKGGVAMIHLTMPDTKEYKGYSVIFIDTSGRKVLDVDYAIDANVYESGFISIRRKINDQLQIIEMYNRNGIKLNLPDSTNNAIYLGEDKFILGLNMVMNKSNGRAKFVIFDAKKQEILQDNSFRI